MRPNFWRVPTDNDVPAGLATRYRPWRDAIPALTDHKFEKNTLVLTRTYLGNRLDQHH